MHAGDRVPVIEFLKGLNSEFEGRQATMFQQPTLPSLEEAIPAIAQEEVRLKVMKHNVTTPSRPAFIVTRKNETTDCFNCGETSRDCHARAGQPVEVVEDMTEVDQEEVAVEDIGLVT